MDVRHPMEPGLRLRPFVRVAAAVLGLWLCWIAWRDVSAADAVSASGGTRGVAVLFAVVGVIALVLAFTGAGQARLAEGERRGDDEHTIAPPPA